MKYNVPLDLDSNNSLAIMLRKIAPDSKILEFGCASGRMTKYMREHLNCRVYIVEKDRESFEAAKEFAIDGICDDILNYAWVPLWKDFDYILFADVLEHLTKPIDVLRLCKTILGKNGSILISVPNIAHNDIIIRLLQNQFRYTSIGLLDDTHVHFFTAESLTELAEQSGFVITDMDFVYMPTGGTEQFWNEDIDIRYELRNILNTRKFGEVYQFVFSLEKRENRKVDFAFTDRLPLIEGKIYPDYGEGFHEENILPVSATVSASGKCQCNYTFIPIRKLKRLRYDPLEFQGCFLTKAVAYSQNQMAAASYSDSIYLGDKIILKGNDPEIIFEFPEYCYAPIVLEVEFEPQNTHYTTILYNTLKNVIEQNSEFQTMRGI